MSALPSHEQFHQARSACIDGFAGIEHAIIELLAQTGTTCRAEQLGQKIDLLRKAKASPQYSRIKRSEVLRLLDDIQPLVPIRNDLVHAPLQIAEIDGMLVAIFVNPHNGSLVGKIARLLTQKQLSQLALRLEKLVDDLGA